jgi:hypothetical protein
MFPLISSTIIHELSHLWQFLSLYALSPSPMRNSFPKFTLYMPISRFVL